MVWIPEWESLPEALRRVADCGTPQYIAKERISTEIAQDRVRVRPYINSDTLGNSDIRIDSKKFYRVPPILKPSDFDWQNSRPINPWYVDRSARDFGWAPTPISFLELNSRDVTDYLCSVVASDESATVAKNTPGEQKSKNKRGALPKFNWQDAKQKFFALMEHHGDFSHDDVEWNCQACAERAISAWFGDQDQYPVESTIRKHVEKWLSEYQGQRLKKADK
jgi:hypothetical protein